MNERLHKIKLNNDNNAKPDIPSQQKLNKLCKSTLWSSLYTQYECKVMITKCKLDYEKTVLKLFEQLTRLK